MNVKFYRNASEKDNNNPNGSGIILNIMYPAQASEAIAIVKDAKGNLLEKPLSYLQEVQDNLPEAVELPPINETNERLEIQLKTAQATIERLELEHSERKVLLAETAALLNKANSDLEASQPNVKAQTAQPKPVTNK